MATSAALLTEITPAVSYVRKPIELSSRSTMEIEALNLGAEAHPELGVMPSPNAPFIAFMHKHELPSNVGFKGAIASEAYTNRSLAELVVGSVAQSEFGSPRMNLRKDLESNERFNTFVDAAVDSEIISAGVFIFADERPETFPHEMFEKLLTLRESGDPQQPAIVIDSKYGGNILRDPRYSGRVDGISVVDLSDSNGYPNSNSVVTIRKILKDRRSAIAEQQYRNSN